MKKSILIVSSLVIIFIINNCSSSRIESENIPGSKVIFATSSETEPEWVKSGKIFWYEPKDEKYYIVGIANNQSDVGFGAAIAQAYALKNLAQKIQTIFNSNFALIEVGNSEDIHNLSELLISVITKNIQMSVVMSEQYWKEWQMNNGYQIKHVYDIYTLNQITKKDLERAISLAIESSKNNVINPDLRTRLDKFKQEVQSNLNNQN
ncbi:hypothetical protein [Rosettibacter firmus]|uniref:hypothetical protein n=1 Tax=Rosettibacter firmus TaxID=3111522 RepID=UPI00336C1F76